jgi:hypothetical protein
MIPVVEYFPALAVAWDGFIVGNLAGAAPADTRIVRALDCGTGTSCAGRASRFDTSSTVEYYPFALAPLVVEQQLLFLTMITIMNDASYNQLQNALTIK